VKINEGRVGEFLHCRCHILWVFPSWWWKIWGVNGIEERWRCDGGEDWIWDPNFFIFN